MQVYDIGIIGAGVGGAIALHKIIKEYKNTKAIIFDVGRPPMKRRRQLEGWLGCLPNSDGKIYLNDTNKVSEITGWRKAKSGNTWVNNLLKNITELNIEEDKGPNKNIIKKIEKYNYQLITNDYFQLYPKDIHSLSKYIADDIDNKENIKTVFDTEIKAIHKHRGIFILNDGLIEYKCKKLIIATGRSGWRWNKNIYDKLGLTVDNSISRYGIKLEIAGCLPLVEGQPLVGRNHDDAVNPELIPLPVAWVKTWTGNKGNTARVFHVTMGSAQDFQSEGLRRMTVNAAYWCLQMEAEIDEKSCMDLVGEYNPPDSGFAYKKLNIVPRKPSFYK